ncbi:MAG: protein DA1 [Ktedonobacteraceae bacterium]|nr:protein DA1 [Ktedonobacteraceae bacterium]
MMQPFCKACGQPIWGRCLNALNANWHPEHFVCAGCGRPIDAASFQMHQGAPYHIQCHTNLIAPRCAYCARPMTNTFLVDYWGTHFCPEHQREYPPCTYCGRLIPPQQLEQPPAEAIRCPVCRSTAIETAQDARPFFNNVKQWISSQGLVYNNLPLSLQICGKTRLAEMLQDRGPTHAHGATVSSTTYDHNGRAVYNEIKGVAVLRGLPATLFQGVTVHELGHVWLIIHNIQGQPQWAEEGFCELLSYRLYQALNTPESQYHIQSIEQNLDPIYGEGFRRIRHRAEQLGWPHFLEAVRTTRRLLL